jgi:hypothetical protein
MNNWRWSKYLQKGMKNANSESSDMRAVVATDQGYEECSCCYRANLMKAPWPPAMAASPNV